MPPGTLPVDRWVAQVWGGYWHASKDDVIQGRLARWYQRDIAFQRWVFAAIPRGWNCWVRTYLRSAVLRLQRWWRRCLGVLYVDQVLAVAANQAWIRATVSGRQFANLGEWKGP